MTLGRRLRRWWRDAQWPVVLGIGVLSVVLGIVGWDQQLDAAGIRANPVDAFYLTVQLFTLQVSGVPDANGFPAALQVARFLAPAVAGYAAARAFMAVFRETSQRVSVRFARDHVVVCGLGDTGLRMVEQLRDAGRPVVAIELQGEGPHVAPAQEAGARVVIGDARDPHLLARIGLGRATHALVLCGSDAVNGEVALALAERVADRRGAALDCRVHVADLGLSARLRSRELGTVPTPGMDIDFFNLYEAGARTMLARNPPFPADATAARVVVVGDGDLARAVVVELARLWSLADSDERLELVVAASAEHRPGPDLLLRFPGLTELCDLVQLDIAPESPDLSAELVAEGSVPPVYVCLDDEVDGLAVGLALVAAGGGHLGPIVVVTDRDAGLGRLVSARTGSADGLRPFGLLDAACDPEVVFGGLWEMLARAIHDDYVARGLADGQTRAANPSLAPWAELPPSLRRSNRDQARHIGTKLERIGARAVPVVTAGGGDAGFRDDEIELLARMEHDRWMRERSSQGWTVGPKDVDARTSPHLVDWEELDDEIRELDRAAVRAIPRLLALAGHRLERPAGP